LAIIKGIIARPVHLLDNHFAGHIRMNRTGVRVGAGLADRERKLLARAEHFGLKDTAVADHGMGDVIAVRPGDLRPCLHRKCRRREVEVIDLDLGFSRDGWGGGRPDLSKLVF
jgi:hypothetical protein